METKKAEFKSRNNRYKLSKYLIKTPSFNKDRNILYFSSRTASSILLNNTIHNLISSADFDTIADNVFYDLLKLKVIVEKQENELDMIINEYEYVKEHKDTLSFTIQPSANCQLGCVYCGQEHENVNLPVDFNEQIISRYKEKLISGKYSKVILGWFGGEPLINIKQIETLSKDFIQIANKAGIGYAATLVTNGLLLNKVHIPLMEYVIFVI